MLADEVVVNEVERQRVNVALEFLRERIRQAHEAAVLHTDREVRPFNVGRASVLGAGVPLMRIFFAPVQIGGL